MLLKEIRVTSKPADRSRGILKAGSLLLPCCLGPSGITHRKREGDGATPAGRFPILSCFFRQDRGPRPTILVPTRAMRRHDGWCDDPDSSVYNQPVHLPFGKSHETMWRGDRLYDLGLVLDYNQRRPRKGLGSAIFMHVMSVEQTPTAGCVALRPGDLRRLLPRLSGRCRIRVG